MWLWWRKLGGIWTHYIDESYRFGNFNFDWEPLWKINIMPEFSTSFHPYWYSNRLHTFKTDPGNDRQAFRRFLVEANRSYGKTRYISKFQNHIYINFFVIRFSIPPLYSLNAQSHYTILPNPLPYHLGTKSSLKNPDTHNWRYTQALSKNLQTVQNDRELTM